MPSRADGQPYVFISYASADRERVLPLVDRLEHASVNTWIDREGIHGGANYAKVISDAIKGANVIVVMTSHASLASRNVRQELALGWRFERPYLPVLLEPVEIPDDLAYWLEGSQWIELADDSGTSWLEEFARAADAFGIDIQRTKPSGNTGRVVREQPLLVGREREQGQLREQLDRMLTGHGGTVLVGGEAGIGKTTLVEDLSAQAEEAGCLVLWGHAYDLSVTPPYGPWLEIFRQYRSVGHGLPPLPAFIGNPEELAKVGSPEALFAGVFDFFIQVSAQRSLTLVLDDLHWFDQASLDLLRYVARLFGSHRILLVATYRSDELHRRHPLYIWLPLVVREAGAVRVNVHPLDEPGHRALIEQRYGLSGFHADRLERYLNDHAEGNPLYAGELLRTLEEERVLVAQEDGWVLGDVEHVRVPPLLRQVIEGRLARLTEETRGMLQVAAVIGQEIPLDLWQQVSNADDQALVTAVEQGQRAQLLAESDGGREYQFRHALIREALYDEVVALRRRVWHGQVAEALTATSNPDPDVVAHHFEQAGDPRAATWLIAAGDRAQRSYAWITASERYEAALSIMTEQGVPVEERVSLLFRAAALNRYADSRRALSMVIEARSMAEEARLTALAAYCRVQEGIFRGYCGERATGVAIMEQGIEELDRLPPADLARLSSTLHRPHIAYAVGSVVGNAAIIGQLQKAKALGEKRIAAVEPPPIHTDQTESPYADGWLGIAIAEALLGHPDSARRAFTRARDIYQSIRHHTLVAATVSSELSVLQLPYFADMGLERLRSLAGEGAAAAHRGTLADPDLDARYAGLSFFFLLGAWSDARVTAASTFWASSRATFRSYGGLGELAALRYWQGDRPFSSRVVADVLPDGPRSEPGNAVLWVALTLQSLLAQMALDDVDLPTARAWLEAHDRWLDWSGAVLFRAEGALGWAQFHHASSDREQSRQFAEQALGQATAPRQPLALMAVHRFLGQLDTEDGQFDVAEDHLRQSLRLAEACQAPFERALTLLEIAKLRMAQGQLDEASALLAEVRSICEPLEAKPTLERVAALERQIAG